MKSTITLIFICFLLSLSISAMQSNKIYITNNTENTVCFYQTTGESLIFNTTMSVDINKGKKKQQLFCVVAAGKENIYHLKIPLATPEIVRLSIGEDKKIEWGDHIAIDEKIRGHYRIIKKNIPRNGMLALLDRQNCKKELSIVPEDRDSFLRSINDTTIVINQLPESIKVCYFKYRNNNKVKKTVYVNTDGSFDVCRDLCKATSSVKIKMPFILQALEIYFPAQSHKIWNMYRKLLFTLSDDKNYIEIRDQNGKVMKMFFIKGTLFNIDTQSAEQLSEGRAIQLTDGSK